MNNFFGYGASGTGALSGLPSSVVNQIKNIGSLAVTPSQWAYLASMDQPVNKGSSTSFSKLGIGQLAGTNALEVTGDTKFSGNITMPSTRGIRFAPSESTGASYVCLDFRNTGNYGIYTMTSPVAAVGHDLLFKSMRWNQSPDLNVLHIHPSGKVGIGQSAGTEALEVTGNIATSSGSHIRTGGGFRTIGSSVATKEYGAHLVWNKPGSGGRSYLLNNKGTGVGGIVIGDVSESDVITPWLSFDSAGAATFAGNVSGQNISSGSFTMNSSGPWLETKPFTFYWSKVGKIVTLACSDMATGDGTTVGRLGGVVPAALKPAGASWFYGVSMFINGEIVKGEAYMNSEGTIIFGSPTTNTTISANSNNNGFYGMTISYMCS